MRIPVDATRPTRTFLRMLLICLLAPAAVAFAQESPPRAAFTLPKDNPLTAWNKYMYGALRNILFRSAEKMPEENYNFKPTDAVRSYGQILGHVADAQYTFCSIALGEKNPAPKIEQKDVESRSDRGAQRRLRLLRQGLRRHDRRVRRSTGEVPRKRHTEARRVDCQQHAYCGALRQPRHLHAAEEHRSSNQRAGLPPADEEMMRFWAGRRCPLAYRGEDAVHASRKPI